MTWNGRPTEFRLTLQSDVAEFRNKAALFALRGLVLLTPVDTGRARGSWTVGVGNQRAIDRGPNSQNAAMSDGIATIAGSKVRPFETIYITNSIPYLPFLNNGTRYIKPQRFVEIVFNDLRVRFG